MALALLGCLAVVARFVCYSAELATSSRSARGTVNFAGHAQNKKAIVHLFCMPEASALRQFNSSWRFGKWAPLASSESGENIAKSQLTFA